MAGQKLTDKTDLAREPASGDQLMVVDISDSTGSAAGTSKKVSAKYVIQTDKISLNNAEVIALDDAGGTGDYKLLVDPGAGYIVVPLQITIIAVGAGVTESANKDLVIGYDIDQTAAYFQKQSRFCSSLASGDIRSYQGTGVNMSGSGANGATLTTKPLYVWSSGTFNGGWAMDIYVTYQIVKAT